MIGPGSLTVSHGECRPLRCQPLFLLNPPELRRPSSSSALLSPWPFATTDVMAALLPHSSAAFQAPSMSWESQPPSASQRNQIPAGGSLYPGLYRANRVDVSLLQVPLHIKSRQKHLTFPLLILTSLYTHHPSGVKRGRFLFFLL